MGTGGGQTCLRSGARTCSSLTRILLHTGCEGAGHCAQERWGDKGRVLIRKYKPPRQVTVRMSEHSKGSKVHNRATLYILHLTIPANASTYEHV